MATQYEITKPGWLAEAIAKPDGYYTCLLYTSDAADE